MQVSYQEILFPKEKSKSLAKFHFLQKNLIKNSQAFNFLIGIFISQKDY